MRRAAARRPVSPAAGPAATRGGTGLSRTAPLSGLVGEPDRKDRPVRPTIVLVHGAFAESASWDPVIDRLRRAGYRVVAAANPLRSLATDAAAVSDVVRSIEGPVVLVAHSYGGAVITNVDPDAGEIVGLVYVNGFAPDAGEHCFQLAAMFPGSMLGETTVQPVPRSDGTTDFYVASEPFHEIFCADVPAPEAASMAVTQRPATQEALTEPSGDRPLWKSVPSWFVIGEQDRIIPPALQRYMAERAQALRKSEVAGASHVVAVSQPDATTKIIVQAASLQVVA
jgi:pimeloyl-ACP methyl ester carboxylesterase